MEFAQQHGGASDKYFCTIDGTPTPTPSSRTDEEAFNGHIFDTHTILLTKSISSLFNLKSNNYKKEQHKNKKMVNKTTTMTKTMMMITQQQQQQQWRQQQHNDVDDIDKDDEADTSTTITTNNKARGE